MIAPHAASPVLFAASGGDILHLGRPLERRRAEALFAFYGRTAWGQRRLGNPAAARACARLALQLAEAITAAEDWRCAAVGRRRRQSVHRRLCEDLKS